MKPQIQPLRQTFSYKKTLTYLPAKVLFRLEVFFDKYNQRTGNKQQIIAFWEKYYNSQTTIVKSLIWRKYLQMQNDWQRIFGNEDNLRKLAGKCALAPRKGCGLVYFYYVDGRLRYIGQTRAKSLKQRLVKQQKSHKTGYNYFIKRNLIRAYRLNSLVIKTKNVSLKNLNKYERQRIIHFGPRCRLWNRAYNRNNFHFANYNI